jgi:hypothetical protein
MRIPILGHGAFLEGALDIKFVASVRIRPYRSREYFTFRVALRKTPNLLFQAAMASTFFTWLRSPAAREYFFSMLSISHHMLEIVSSYSSQVHTSGDQSVISTFTSCIAHSFQVANWGLPLAALADLSKDEEVISGSMTTALGAYSYVPFHSHAATCSPTHLEWFSCASVRSVMMF